MSPTPRTTTVTDADLAARAARGDADAFGELLERYAPAARRLARAALGNHDDGDDAAQDGFLAAWQNFDKYDAARPFGPWLLRIVVNRARDLGRRRKVRQTDELPPDRPADIASPERETDRSLLRAQLAEALDRLPERQRIAITLFDGEGYPHAEIARMLDVPEGTVRSDVFHARRTLREALGQWQGGTA
ncbi:MAG TPA: sigma-70 family RNA polymerase sigma factor [Gemmatimonadales bacterium]|nr:sigma-70 family RNA polymerase sigma factor [Gemmatimonadales bacterium]